MPIKDLRYVPDYLDAAIHDSLLAAADLHPWQRSAGRGVQIYGYRYHHPTTSVFRIGELPQWAGDVAARLFRDGLLGSVPNQLVVNDYEVGAGIVAHVDQPAFGDQVASISLGSTCVMQFSKKDGDPPAEILLEPRSVLGTRGRGAVGLAPRHSRAPRGLLARTAVASRTSPVADISDYPTFDASV